MKSLKTEPWLSGGLIALVTILSYGILVPQLGFYRDDWYMLWAGQSNLGLSGILQLFQTDRPLIGWTYAALFKLLGPNALAWQSAALLFKAGTGLAVFWLLRRVWPEKRLETTCAALLFVLYPGFYQQPVAATFIIDLIGLNAAFISIGLTVFSLQTPRRWLKVTAALLAAALAALTLGLPYSVFFQVMGVSWSMPLLGPLCLTMVAGVALLVRQPRLPGRLRQRARHGHQLHRGDAARRHCRSGGLRRRRH